MGDGVLKINRTSENAAVDARQGPRLGLSAALNSTPNRLGSRSLRARLLIFLTALLIIGVVSQSTLINRYLLQDFRQLEQAQVESSLNLMQLWLDRFLQPMEGLAREIGRSASKPEYDSAAGRDSIVELLAMSHRTHPSFNFAVMLDADGEAVLSAAFVRGAPSQTAVPTQMITRLQAHADAAGNGPSAAPLAGWSTIPGGLLASASHPIILPSGTYNLVLGLEFDALEMASLEQLSNTRIQLARQNLQLNNPPENPGIGCFGFSKKLSNSPSWLCVQLQESIFKRGQRTVADLQLASLVGFVVLMFGAWWFTDRSLLRRLADLTDELDSTESGDTGKLEQLMLEDGKRGDEIGKMSSGMGRLLGRVRQAEADMRERERSFRALAESASVAIFVINKTIRYTNPHASKLTGYASQELQGRELQDFIAVESRDRLLAALDHGSVVDPALSEIQGRRQNGSDYWAILDVSRIEYEGATALLVTLFDVTEQRHLEKAIAFEKQNLQLILSSIQEGIVSVDHLGTVRFLNQAAQRMTGLSLELANGNPLDDVVSLKDVDNGTPLPKPLLGHLASKEGKGLVANVTTTRGESHSVEVSSSQQEADGRDEQQGSVLVMRDISDLRQLTQTLAQQASHDDLTSLINRREFSRRLLEAIQAAKTHARSCALCYVDLDQFKLLNDTCGHHAGDLMLREVAEALKGKIRKGDTLARLGGDEFGVLLFDASGDQAIAFANELRETVCDVRFHWNGQSFRVDASIGIVMLEHVEGSIDEALALADAACYMAKDLGRNRVQMYKASDIDLQEQLKHMRWATQLKEAVENSRFTLYAQKIAPVSMRAPDLNSFEALVRMKQSDGRIVTPGEFLAAAERYQMMTQIDQWVVSAALEALNRRAKEGGQQPLLFINLSGQSLGDESFRDFLLDKLARHKPLRSRIVFEVTESAVISSIDRAKALMDEVHKLGCKFALDDFGTGMSSFSYLKELRVNYLKIAGCFVKGVDSPLDRAVVRSFTEFARMMKVTVIAEWIENASVMDTLREMGVDYGQGWHLGRPEPIDEALAKRK